jgi:low temperature requirement protein LtrA
MLFIFVLQSMFALPVSLSSLLTTFPFFYALLFNAWVGNVFYNTRFDTDDVISKLSAILNMLCVSLMALSLSASPSEPSFPLFISSYAAIRTVLVFNYYRAYLALPVGRPLTGRFMLGFSLSLLCMATAIALSLLSTTPSSYKYLPATLGIFIDYGTPFLLLPRMVTVHPTHCSDRFASFTVLMFTGILFNFMQTLGQPSDSSHSLPTYLSCVLLGVCLSFFFVLLYSKVPNPKVDGFEINIFNKLRVYVYLYLHMPLCLTTTVVSTTVGHIDCLGGTHHSSPHALSILSVSCAIMLSLIGVLHILGAVKNKRKALLRFFSGALIVLLKLFLNVDDCRPVLTCIVVVLGSNVILDNLVWMDLGDAENEGRARLGNSSSSSSEEDETQYRAFP